MKTIAISKITHFAEKNNKKLMKYEKVTGPV